jgi:diphthine synthase
VRSSARVFLEAYTSILTVGTDRLEALYGKPVTVADRETVESVRRFLFFCCCSSVHG